MGDERRVAGLLLTGGRSRRLGRDKATLPGPGGTTLAAWLGQLLSAATTPTLEVGPGRSGLPAILEAVPGDGPLAAVVAGWQRVRELAPATTDVVVLAVDQAYVTAALIAALAGHPSDASVVPVDDRGRPQPTVARYAAAELEAAVAAHASGDRSLRPLLAGAIPVGLGEWAALAAGAAVDDRALDDVDEPADLERYLTWLAHRPTDHGPA